MMKRFLTYIIYFSLIILACAAVIEATLRVLPNSFKLKESYMTSKADSIEVLIIGNSYTYMGVDPRWLTLRAFNAANAAQPLECDYFIAQKYMTTMSNLKYVVLPVSSFSLFGPPFDESDDWWRIAQYRLYMDYKEYRNPKYAFEICNVNGTLMRLKTAMFNWPALVKDTELGYCKEYTLAMKKADWDDGKTLAAKHDRGVAYPETFERNVAYLDSIVELCEQQGVKIILVTTPLRKSYRDNLNRNQVSQMFDLIDCIAAADSSVTVVNLFGAEGFGDDDFYDPNHMTELGTEKLTHKLDSVIMKNLRGVVP